MLLRASSDAVGAEVDLSAAVEDAADGGVEDGAVLTAFAEAVVRATDDLDAARARALETLGPEKFVEAGPPPSVSSTASSASPTRPAFQATR